MGRITFVAVAAGVLRRAVILILLAGSVLILVPQAEAPTSPQSITPLTGIRIAIDPGHGGVDSGCHYQDISEKDLSLTLAQTLAALLTREGAEVMLTRTQDISLEDLVESGRSRHRRDLEARVELARRHQAEIFISMHTNYGRNSGMQGAVTFHPRMALGMAPAARKLATLVQTELQSVMPGNQNDVLPARFLLLSSLAEDMLPILVEAGFLSNPVDRAALLDPAQRDAIAAAIVRGIRAYLISGYDDVEAPAAALPIPPRGASEEHGCTSDKEPPLYLGYGVHGEGSATSL